MTTENKLKRAGKVQDLFSAEKLLNIKSVLSKLPDALPSRGKSARRAYTNGIDDKHLLYPWVQKEIAQPIKNALNIDFKVTVAMHLKEFSPWGIHTDYDKGDSDPYLAFLIPLEIYGPVESKTHTVIFNEECLDSFSIFKENNKKVENNATDLSNSLCSHCNKQDLEYVSLLQAVEWNIGDLIFWDQKLLHSSDNFLDSNIIEKQAIVIFSKIV
jgi:hypothetical protein